jgi:hypothetical protein
MVDELNGAGIPGAVCRRIESENGLHSELLLSWLLGILNTLELSTARTIIYGLLALKFVIRFL